MAIAFSAGQSASEMLRIATAPAVAEWGWMSMLVVYTVMVGRMPDGAVAISAASLGSALFYAFAIFAIGLMSGLDTLVSRADGANDCPAARRALSQGNLIP
jgi:Na+-driven multidrug efflux pump